MEEPEHGHAGRDARDGALALTPSPPFAARLRAALSQPPALPTLVPSAPGGGFPGRPLAEERGKRSTRPRVWPKGLEENLVLLRFGSSSLPEGMTAGVAGPGVLQNEDPLAMCVHHDCIRS
eukprot:2776945-Rhodomonas_salina.1